MTTQIQRRRGTTSEHSTFTGAVGEITVDTTKDTVVVHDGSTTGGHPLAKENNPSFTGNVGIGTTSPTFQLHVANSSGNSESVVAQYGAGTQAKIGAYANDVIIESDNNDNARISFKTGSTERLRITSAGNVGIGTTSPATELHVYGGSGDIATIVQSGSIVGRLLTNSAGTYVGTTTNNDFTIQTNSQSRVIVKNTGNVGVGTTSPNAKLHVAGAASIGGSQQLRFYNSDTSALCWIQAESTSGGTNPAMRFGTSNAEKMRIDTSGRLLVGTSSSTSYPNLNGTTVNPLLQVTSDADAEAGIVLRYNSGGAGSNRGPTFCFQRYTDGTSVPDGRNLGEITWQGEHDGSNTIAAASIRAHVDSASGTNDMPGRLVFSTTADGASSPTERLRIDSSGNVGIGTTSPGQKLVVSEGGAQGLELNPTSATAFVLAGYNRNTSAYIDLDYQGNNHIFRNGTTERLRIDSSGRLLVGTTNGGIIYGGDSNNALQVRDGASSKIVVHRQTDDVNAAYLRLAKGRLTSPGTVQNNDEIGRIEFIGHDGTDLASRLGQISCYVDGTPGSNDTPGRLVFSTTADGASSPTERMRIRENGSTSLYADSDTYSNIRSAGTSSTGTAFGVFNGATATVNGTLVMVVRQDGDLENTNNSYTGLSDIRLKENVVDASSQWNDIKDLRVRNYNFKEETNYGTHTQIGLVAQEVELVSPGLVKTCPDRDDEGNDLGTTTKTVKYSVLYMKAVKALQEAMERIEALEAKVTALESN